MRDYGLRVYRQGIEFHPDDRKRDNDGQAFEIVPRVSRFRKRGTIKAWSAASSKRLAFVCANVDGVFRSIVTLTYHAPVESWETDKERNGRIAARCKEDLNRFLSCMRRELGGYVWVQEYQARGVVHFHLLCEREVGERRVQLAWCRSIDAVDDAAALKYGARVEVIRSEDAARSYLGRYVGKQRQKLLPPGVDGSGRWWGCSQSLKPKVISELVVVERRAQEHHPIAKYVMRCVRRYLRKRLGFKFRRGLFVNWGGELAGKVAAMVPVLQEGFIRQTESHLAQIDLGNLGWDVVEGVEFPCENESKETLSCSCLPESSEASFEHELKNWRNERLEESIALNLKYFGRKRITARERRELHDVLSSGSRSIGRK